MSNFSTRENEKGLWGLGKGRNFELLLENHRLKNLGVRDDKWNGDLTMKVVEYYWDHPQLARFTKKLSEGNYLFRQGDSGNTMFIITQGFAELLAMREKREYVTSILDAGDFLGEMAILSTQAHNRVFSARAKTELTVLELGLGDIESINRNEPELMADILKRIFQIAADRLHQTHLLIHSLRSSSPWDRVAGAILYLCRTTGRRIPEGVEVLLSAASIHYFTDLPVETVETNLTKLDEAKLLLCEGNDTYILPSEKNLLKALPDLKAKLAKAS